MELYLYISIALLAVCVAIAFSIHLLIQHLLNYNYPEYQKHICRIVVLVPLYGSMAAMSMLVPSRRLWFEAIRDTYEAFVVYNFLVLMINYCGGERKLELNLETKAKMEHPWPFNHVFHKIQPGREFLRYVRAGSLQFVFLRPVLSLTSLFLHTKGLYDENYFGLDSAYVYIFVATNLAFAVSFYCLTLLYMACSDYLRSYNVVSKFLCIKLVVFFCFWQQAVIMFLTKIEVIRSEKALSSEDKAVELNNFLICIEMLFASLGHTYAYGAHEFKILCKASSPIAGIKNVFNAHDLIDDARGYMRPIDRDFELCDQEVPQDPFLADGARDKADKFREPAIEYSKV